MKEASRTFNAMNRSKNAVEPIPRGVSASTERPLRLKFAQLPNARDLRAMLQHEIPIFFDDVHGTPEYRKHMTFYFAEEIRRELSSKILA
jgi:hypothetical protein